MVATFFVIELCPSCKSENIEPVGLAEKRNATMNLPTFQESKQSRKRTALQTFIFEWEPTDEEEQFRRELSAVIDEAKRDLAKKMIEALGDVLLDGETAKGSRLLTKQIVEQVCKSEGIELE